MALTPKAFHPEPQQTVRPATRRQSPCKTAESHPCRTGDATDILRLSAVLPKKLPFGEHSLVHIDWAAGSTGLDGIVHSWTYAHPVALALLWQNFAGDGLNEAAGAAVKWRSQ